MNHGDPDESFLTVAEVAETLKLNQQTVRNWIDQGSLPALRVGRRVRIRRSDFERLLTEGYTAAGATAGSRAARARRTSGVVSPSDCRSRHRRSTYREPMLRNPSEASRAAGGDLAGQSTLAPG